jgi:hypothetical protein
MVQKEVKKNKLPTKAELRIETCYAADIITPTPQIRLSIEEGGNLTVPRDVLHPS